MKTIKYFIIIISLIQSYAFSQNIYKVPIGSTENIISIKVTNPTEKELQEINVNIVNKPDWVKFKYDEITLEKISSNQSVNLDFSFDIIESVPLDEIGKIDFIITSSNKSNWQKSFEIKTILPDKCELMQNYPNPFNPTTTIKYSLTKDNFVELKVFSVLGETIKVLVNEEQKGGFHSVQFDATQLSSGVYFYSIESGDYKAVKKMMLIK